MGGSKGLEMGAGGEVFDLGITKFLKKLMPLDKQAALTDKMEGAIKKQLSKFI